MRISARIQNSQGKHDITLQTNDRVHSLAVPSQPTGFGSGVNGGEMLFLALATCYCNDVYREAAKRGIQVKGVEVSVEGDFGSEGEAARGITYAATVKAKASEKDIRELMEQTDKVAEIQNMLRRSTPVTLSRVDAVSV